MIHGWRFNIRWQNGDDGAPGDGTGNSVSASPAAPTSGVVGGTQGTGYGGVGDPAGAPAGTSTTSEGAGLGGFGQSAAAAGLGGSAAAAANAARGGGTPGGGGGGPGGAASTGSSSGGSAAGGGGGPGGSAGGVGGGGHGGVTAVTAGPSPSLTSLVNHIASLFGGAPTGLAAAANLGLGPGGALGGAGIGSPMGVVGGPGPTGVFGGGRGGGVSPSLSGVAGAAGTQGAPAPALSDLATALQAILMGDTLGGETPGGPSTVGDATMGYPAANPTIGVGGTPQGTPAPVGTTTVGGAPAAAPSVRGPGSDATAPTSTYGNLGNPFGVAPPAPTMGYPALNPGKFGSPASGATADTGGIFGPTATAADVQGESQMGNVSTANTAPSPVALAVQTANTVMGQTPAEQSQTVANAIAVAQQTMNADDFQSFLTHMLALWGQGSGEGEAQSDMAPTDEPGFPDKSQQMTNPPPGVMNPDNFNTPQNPLRGFSGGV